MKKILRKTICLLAVGILMLGCTTAVFAGVTYENQAEKFIFSPGSDFSKTDLFDDMYKGVMPGDTILDTITVRNNAGDDVEVEIFMRALGATDLQNPEDGDAEVSQAASADFLKELDLQVVHENGTVLYEAGADETAQLTDWVSLGRFKSGEEADLQIQLLVPIEMNNDFAAKIGALDWQFKVNEYEIVEPTEPSEEPIKETKTGDDMNLIVPIALMGAAALILIILLATRRRKQEQ